MDIKDFLYYRLPEIYRTYDADHQNPYPLKRYLDVLTEGGLQELLRYIEDLRRVQNIDECPRELLPLVAQQYGLDFPYDMDEASQRKFIKVLPKLYANKGTEEAFMYLAREIFGQGTNLKTEMNKKPDDMTEEEWEKTDEWKKLLIYLEINGETLMLGNKHINFLKFCEIIRPVNTTVISYLALFYEDAFDRKNKVHDPSNLDIVHELTTEQVPLVKNDDYTVTSMWEEFKEVYKADHTPIDEFLDFITTAIETEIVPRNFVDSHIDKPIFTSEETIKIAKEDSYIHESLSSVDSDTKTYKGEDSYNTEFLSVIRYETMNKKMDDSGEAINIEIAPESETIRKANEGNANTKIVFTKPLSLLNNLSAGLNTVFSTNQGDVKSTILDY